MVISNCGAVATVATLGATEPGSVIFPIRHTFIVIAFSAIGLFVGVPYSIAALWSSTTIRRRLSACAATIGCLMPLPLSSVVLNQIAKYVGFDLD